MDGLLALGIMIVADHPTLPLGRLGFGALVTRRVQLNQLMSRLLKTSEFQTDLQGALLMIDNQFGDPGLACLAYSMFTSVTSIVNNMIHIKYC